MTVTRTSKPRKRTARCRFANGLGNRCVLLWGCKDNHYDGPSASPKSVKAAMQPKLKTSPRRPERT